MKRSSTFAAEAQTTAKKHIAIQKEVARADKGKKKSTEKPMQAGARKYPEPPLPGKTLKKPGKEATLTLEPFYDAPFYKGSDKLKDKVAIITGGDSGIGRAVAILFAREGADVVIAYLNEHEDAKRTKQLVEEEGRSCLILSEDVTDVSFCEFVVDQTIKEFEQIDVLVNNAAFQLHVPDIEALSDEHFDTTLKTNLYGYFYMTRAVVPHLKNGSSIINTGSVTGIQGNPTIPDYSMTKGGIHAWTRSLGTQLIQKGIRVNCVAPGPVWTPLNPSDKKSKDVKEFGSMTAMMRPAQPEEIAPAYVFFASPHCSSYITGEVLPIIGGYSGA